MADLPPPPDGFVVDQGPVYGTAPKPQPNPSGYAPAGNPVTPLAPVPGGPADPTKLPDPPQGYHYAKGGASLEPIPGGPKDPHAPDNGLTPAALDDATAKLILTSQMDPMGMGGGPVRLQILNNRGVMLQKYGITDQQLPAIRSQFQADSNAYNQRLQQLSFIQQAADAANNHVHQITGYLSTLPAQTDARALNAVSNFAQRQMSGDTITQLDATIPLLKAEFGKIMTANPSGAAELTDDARHDFDILESNGSPHSRMLALQALVQMGQGKIAGLQSEAHSLNARLSGGLQTYAQLVHGGTIGGPPAPGGTPGGGNPPGSTPPNGTDPSVQNVGGFNDELPSSPKGANEFHDALFAAAQGKQFNSVADAQKWADGYNQQHGTDFGVADTPLTRQAIANAASGKSFSVEIPQMTQGEAARMDARVKGANSGPGAATLGAADTLTIGGFKPLIAAGDTLSDALSGKGLDYTGNLNADTGYVNQVRQGNVVPFVGGQLAGALALPTFGARAIPELAQLGAGYGGLYGFNSSAGQPLGTKAMNALSGAVEGAAVPIALGAGAKAAGAAKNALSSVRSVLPETGLPINADALAQAGQQEGVTVNRAMVNPALQPKVTAVGKTMIGANKLQSSMRDVGQQIQSGVDNLSNGTPLEPQAAGNTVAGAGLRYITQTGQQFNRLYGALRSATDGTKIPATQATQQVDDLLSSLSEMPNQNAKEISYLQGLKQDLSQPLTIDAMRGLRTKIRQDLASGQLTFGPAEGRVASIADAASQDISSGLTAAGKPDVAQRFQQVDQAYRDRMDMIQGTIQKLIGKRSQNLGGEQVFGNLKTMAGPRGNASGLTRMLEQMTPEERADTAATFADALGKNPQGDFSTAYLAKQVNAMPQAMRSAVFGQEGAQSLNNLGMLARAHARVSSALGNSPTALARDYRGWLTDLVLGAGAGVLTGNAGKGAAVAATAAGVKAGRDFLNARMLLNPDIEKWLSSAPATNSQRAIDVHFNRLNSIAARNPGIAQDIMNLKQAVLSAANSNTPVTGTAAASPDQGPAQQQ